MSAIKMRITEPLNGRRSDIIKISKLLLILGVVLIHCNLVKVMDIETADAGATWLTTFISLNICSICVPGFFMISGYLYFHNVSEFSLNSYLSKSKRRIHTLLIPYLLWNLIGLILQILGYKYLGLPSYGIVEGNHLNGIKIIEGFWNLQSGYPYAIAFWFIRNLIIFAILSPIAYFIADRKSLFVIFLLALFIFNYSIYQFEYFVAGAFIALKYPRIIFNINIKAAIAFAAVWIGLSVMAKTVGFPQPISVLLNFVLSVSAFLSIMGFSALSLRLMKNGLFRKFVASTFFIYAIHQFFVTICKKFFLNTIGYETFITELLSYFCTFSALVAGSYIGWRILSKLCPKITGILGGGR